MRKLKIDLGELTIAFENSGWEMNHYLDLETGQVIVVDAEIQRQLENLCAELGDAGVESPDNLAKILRERGLLEWEQEAMLAADEIERGYSSRYVGIPQDDSHTAYGDMEDFIVTVQDDYLRGCLSSAILGRGAFRRFKDVLLDYPRERDRWFAFKDEQVRQRVLGWLAIQDIEPIISEPSPEEVLEPDLPPARALLIAEVLAFVRAARQLPGVVCIALIGSLTTNEPDPKDADVLVTVTDDADLKPVATLGRKLAGHAQSFRRGGDVFLADPRGNYLGRTCPWRECAPGIRMRCDALHCGRRPYLHDDWEAIRLDETLVAAPPIELWPEIAARVPVPEDIEQELIAPLREVGQGKTVKDAQMSKRHQQMLEREWEQTLIDAYYDHRWHQVLDPLYEKFQRWKAGDLTHEDMDQAIHETHKQNQDLYRLFRENRGLLVGLIQWDREWLDGWVADNPPPSGVKLVLFPD